MKINKYLVCYRVKGADGSDQVFDTTVSLTDLTEESIEELRHVLSKIHSFRTVVYTSITKLDDDKAG